MKTLVLGLSLALGLSGCVVHYYPDAPRSSYRTVVSAPESYRRAKPEAAPRTVSHAPRRTEPTRRPAFEAAPNRSAARMTPRPKAVAEDLPSRVVRDGDRTARRPTVRDRVSASAKASRKEKKALADDRRAIAFGYQRPADPALRSKSETPRTHLRPLPARNRDDLMRGLERKKTSGSKSKKKPRRKTRTYRRAQLK